MSLSRSNSKSTSLRRGARPNVDDNASSSPATSDRRLAIILSVVRDEVLEGCPSGQAFEQAIAIALLACIASRPDGVQDAPCRELRLSQAQAAVVVKYISANLTDHICVGELAALLEMSPSHFTRIFSSTTGMPPYRFVLKERINGSKEMLISTRLSASAIASTYGFSSQSHFTKVFRQFTGMTPKQYKASAKLS